MDLESPVSDRVESGELVGTATQPGGYHPRSNSPRPVEVTLDDGGAETGARQAASGTHYPSGQWREDIGARLFSFASGEAD